MQHEFRLFPDQASSFAPQVDALYFFLLGIAGFFTLAIFMAIVYLALRYRRGRPKDRPHPHPQQFWIMEAAWIGIPFLLTMIMFGWGATLYFDMRTPPTDAIELQVVGKQWMWKIQHPQGRSEINNLHVPTGRPVRLNMISEDVIHSFYLPAFRVKMDVLPDRYSTLWFDATEPGEYYLFCAEYCGTDHADMSGRVVVMEPADYAAWLSGATTEPPQAAGEKLFTQFRCQTCHHEGPDARCPNLKELFGRTVALADGRTALVDEAYVRESILQPLAKVAAGFQPVMPTYQGQLSEEQIQQLVEYLKSLSPAAAKSGGASSNSAKSNSMNAKASNAES
jgi:cytochrome c oxidase subunit II